ncbi:nucleotide exchange factor GrpE [Baileyella intestinalis]|uniref:nucleotide exchange factor GrpE n=1 Tax=Baileyella intestinalis TaxID=2606709 RepID=UPI0022E874BD|nr:nucleotide exchange factor GrpE [Baileyella intestinalis]
MSELNEQTAQMEDQETSTGTGEDKAEPEKTETNQAESSANKASEETGDDQDAPEEEKADSQPEGSEAPEEKADSVKTAEQQKKEDDEKYMRLMAEFQNYKKRVAKEKQDIQSFANEKIITELLEVLDNFERSLEHSSDADENYVKGMEMIFQQLKTAMEKAGLKEIQALGEDFDPAVHNAVMQEESDELESGKVSKVLQKGYKLNDKVIRAAMVAVAK